jgi:nicotinamide riboside kinase
MTRLSRGAVPCHCRLAHHQPSRIVLTGGPGAGKTAVLEMILQSLCVHLAVLPESASIVFGGGFPRLSGVAARRSSQRAIYHVQREVERLAVEELGSAIALCDRGTLDGLAYWPDSEERYFEELGTSLECELARYAAVIHLRVPPESAYNRDNALRIESAEQAAAIDARIEHAWSQHPRRMLVTSTKDFVDKAARAIDLVRRELPPCCRAHMDHPNGGASSPKPQ